MLLTLKELIIVIGTVAGFLIITVLGKRWGWYELIGGTNKLLREQNTILTEQNTTLKQEVKELIDKNEQNQKDSALKHEANVRALSTMQGQIDVLKNIPLGNIDATLVEIRDTLKSSAVVLALDTRDAASAAKEVKSALNKNDSAIASNAEIVRLTLLKNTADAALAAALVKTTLAGGKK